VCYHVNLKHLEEGDPYDTVLHMCGDKKRQKRARGRLLNHAKKLKVRCPKDKQISPFSSMARQHHHPTSPCKHMFQDLAYYLKRSTLICRGGNNMRHNMQHDGSK